MTQECKEINFILDSEKNYILDLSPKESSNEHYHHAIPYNYSFLHMHMH